MIKKELVKALSEKMDVPVTNEEVKLILDSVFKFLKEEVEKGTSGTLSKATKIKAKRSPSWSEEEIRQKEWDRFIES